MTMFLQRMTVVYILFPKYSLLLLNVISHDKCDEKKMNHSNKGSFVLLFLPDLKEIRRRDNSLGLQIYTDRDIKCIGKNVIIGLCVLCLWAAPNLSLNYLFFLQHNQCSKYPGQFSWPSYSMASLAFPQQVQRSNCRHFSQKSIPPLYLRRWLSGCLLALVEWMSSVNTNDPVAKLVRVTQCETHGHVVVCLSGVFTVGLTLEKGVRDWREVETRSK